MCRRRRTGLLPRPESRRRQVPVSAGQHAALEKQRKAVVCRFFAHLAEGIVVIPAVAIERIPNQRRAQDEPDLALGHSELELRDCVRADDISLRDADPELGKASAKQAAHEQQQANDNNSHFGFGAKCFTLPA